MASAAVAYCLQKLKAANSDSECFHSVLVVHFVGMKQMSHDPEVFVEVFEEIDFCRLMQPDVVLSGEPQYVVHCVMLQVLMWFLQCKGLFFHDKLYQLLPFIVENITNANYDIENDICGEIIHRSYLILGALAEDPVCLNKMIKAKVPNLLCVPAGTFNGISRAKNLLIHFASKVGKHMWYEGDIDGLELFLIKYVNWIKIQRDETIGKELEVMRVILASIDPTIHKLQIEESWSIIIRDVIGTMLCSKPRAEHRDIALRVTIQLVNILGGKFVLGAKLKFLVQLVVLASTQICIGLENVRAQDPVNNEDLLYVCCDFLAEILKERHIISKEQEERINSPIRRAIRAVVGFLKRIGQLDESNQDCEIRNVKLNADKNTHDEKDGKEVYRIDSGDKIPNGASKTNCLMSKIAQKNALPEWTMIENTVAEWNDLILTDMNDRLSNTQLGNGCSDCRNKDIDKNDSNKKNTGNHVPKKEIRSENNHTCEKMTADDIEMFLTEDNGLTFRLVDLAELEMEFQHGENGNHERQLCQYKNEDNRHDDQMKKNGHENNTVKGNGKQVKPVNIMDREKLTSPENNASCCDIPPFVLVCTQFMCQWIVASVDPSGEGEEIMELLPFLVHVTRYTLSQLHNVKQYFSPKHTHHRHILVNVIATLRSVIHTRNETMEILILENLPEVLEKYVDIIWKEYNKTTRLVHNTKRKPQTQPNHQSQEKDSNVEHEKDSETEQDICQLQKVQDEQTFLLCNLLELLISIISEKEDHVQTHDMYPRLCQFAVANLPYLETNGENIKLTFYVMTMGLILLESLGYAGKSPNEFTAVSFFESCVSFLGDVHQLPANYRKRAKKGKYIVINVSPRFQENWESYMESLWANGMEAIAECIPIFPSLSKCILDADWIPEILKMLKYAKAEMDEAIYHRYYGKVLTACARGDPECNDSILENNGLAIAKKFHFDQLENTLL